MNALISFFGRMSERMSGGCIKFAIDPYSTCGVCCRWDRRRVVRRSSHARILLAGLVALLFGIRCESTLIASPEAFASHFVVNGKISVRQFAIGKLDAVSVTESDICFYYNSGLWEVQAEYPNARTNEFYAENCMKIPEGTRHYALSGTQGTNIMTAAVACPLPFPPPGRISLFAPWLALCPRPELPLIDSHRMHRFVNGPVCEADILLLPENQGYYQISYLGTEKQFLAELTISNNGVSVVMGVGADGQPVPEIQALPNSYKSGFLQYRYQVLETTNMNGILFPLHSIYDVFDPDWSDPSHRALNKVLEADFVIEEVAFTNSKAEFPGAAPNSLLALDARPPICPETPPLITWLSATTGSQLLIRRLLI